MVSTSEFKKGLKIVYKGEPYEIIDFQHVKMQQRAPIVRTKIKNLKTGRVLEENFSSGDKFEKPELEERQMQYLYAQGDSCVFMDMESYEQVTIPRQVIGDAIYYIKEEMMVDMIYYKGEPLVIEPPMFVELRVADTEPAFKGDTASGGTKPARLETGLTVKVPFHIQTGDLLKIDTRTGEYIEKVKE
ncbi:MAG TPA: elongation factor P [Thermodesulfovibrio thiophilus]|uniref:elongation factor P n=1 Tax=Thermodesulfovibrio thiophilus TaxID=340095 RepID=UPI00041D43B7|nr:elongation factor P [Thermodesulfovibrio thiophilus]HHW20703.1 elongation factor P [Thermodesulfovibrio thiophilus]HOA82777.1 elongation factor P [Thermodesulfovibrio thiophilus]HQA03533.1 elongation factor P [Thermodesulfovibrio thiophilus]HQD36918.1 elongation factor P [Thermodesulfovibrio thiophilus]